MGSFAELDAKKTAKGGSFSKLDAEDLRSGSEYRAARSRIEKSNARGPKQTGLMDAFTMGAGNVIPIQDEISGALSGLRQAGGALVHGRDVGQAFKGGYAAGKDVKQQDIDALAAQHPIAYNAGSILAGLGRSVPGGPAAAQAGSKLVETAKNGLKAAGVGGGLGALIGAADSEGAEGRLKGAATGGALGAALGGGLSVAGEAIVNPALKTTARIANKATGGKLINPNRLAAQRLTEALRKDGLNAQQVQTAMNEWLKNGNTPQLMNLAGENTRRLIRAAAGKGGEAGAVAAGNVEALAADLQGNAISRTRALTPEKRTAQIVSDAIKAKRAGLATTQYREAYQTPVKVTDEVRSVLTDAPGKAALRQARADALERRDLARVAELDKLLAADAPLDMSQPARMARAQEQGFTTNAYHGTPNVFENGQIDLARAGTNSDTHSKGAFFATDNPAVANTYAGRPYATLEDLQDHLAAFDRHLKRIQENGLGDTAYNSVKEQRDAIAAQIMKNIEGDVGGNVQPLLLKTDDYLKADAGGQGWYDHVVPNKFKAMAQGKPGAQIDNVIDPGALAMAADQVPATTYVITDPSTVRSRFDPFAPPGYNAGPEKVSAAALDRAQIAMRERGNRLARAGNNARASGSLARRDVINQALEAVPALQPARQTYRGMTAQGDALDLGGSNAFNNPDEYIQALRDKIAMATPVDNPFPVSGDDIRGAAGVGLARDIERQIGAPTEAATGFLNKLSTGTNQRRVLEETFPGQAEQYREAINQLVGQLNDARFISPNHGSQTALRLEDAGLIDAIPTSKTALLAKLVDAIKSGASITDAEREAIVRLGIASPADLMGLQIGPGLLDRVSPALRQLGASSSAQTGRGQ